MFKLDEEHQSGVSINKGSRESDPDEDPESAEESDQDEPSSALDRVLLGTSLPISIPVPSSFPPPPLSTTAAATETGAVPPTGLSISPHSQSLSHRHHSYPHNRRTSQSRSHPEKEEFMAPHLLSAQTYRDTHPWSVFGDLPPSSSSVSYRMSIQNQDKDPVPK